MEVAAGAGPQDWSVQVVRSGAFRVLVIGNRVGELLSPLPGICNDFLIQDPSEAEWPVRRLRARWPSARPPPGP